MEVGGWVDGGPFVLFSAIEACLTWKGAVEVKSSSSSSSSSLLLLRLTAFFCFVSLVAEHQRNRQLVSQGRICLDNMS